MTQDPMNTNIMMTMVGWLMMSLQLLVGTSSAQIPA